MAVRIITTEVKECSCEVKGCGHIWHTAPDYTPMICPKCRSRLWNGVRRMGRPPSASVPLTMAKKRKRT
jgi:hypothetical protein